MRNFLTKLFDLREGSDFKSSIDAISLGVSLRGYNLWMLGCSSILACIGLDTNSTAVIIGAMLISPLMSPILGVGLSVGIQNKRLLLKSLRNLFIAVLITLITSILYFTITPLGNVTEELQARTYPTLLDVAVALFGGLAGIISISRRDQTNAVPGVAIATALMPPLCTAGFGLASGSWTFFLGAFYLFTLNAVFIAMATYLIVKYLHFPEQHFENRRMRRVYSFWFNTLSIIAILPSIYFLYTVYVDEQRKVKINKLVISRIEEQGNEILKWEMEDKDSVVFIKVYHSGNRLSDSLMYEIDSTLQINRLGTHRLQPMRVNLTKEEVSQLSAEVAKQMYRELHLTEVMKKETAHDSLSYVQISKEVKAFLPVIDSSYNGWITIPSADKTIDTLAAFFYTSQRPLVNSSKQRLELFLKERLVKDSVVIFYTGKR